MNLIPVQSSAISAIGYDSTTGQMYVQFKHGKVYAFCGVPQHVYEAFLSAGSKGHYYDTYIRDRYQC
jgi:hypothetical protein